MACALLDDVQGCLSNIILKPPSQEGNCCVHQKVILDTSDMTAPASRADFINELLTQDTNGA